MQEEYGELEVPQGQTVQIQTQNQVVNVGNEAIPLNATLRVRVMVQQQEHILAFNSTAEEEIEIEENGIKIRTKETIRVTNQKILVGANQSEILVFPLELRQRIGLKNMTQVQLHLQNGNPYYEVNGTKAGKLFWLFDVDIPIQAQVHAQTGDVEKQQDPWCAFLVAYQQE